MNVYRCSQSSRYERKKRPRDSKITTTTSLNPYQEKKLKGITIELFSCWFFRFWFSCFTYYPFDEPRLLKVSFLEAIIYCGVIKLNFSCIRTRCSIKLSAVFPILYYINYFLFFRWHNHLNPNINKEAWTQEEELALIRAHQIYGNRWAELTKFLPGRYVPYVA